MKAVCPTSPDHDIFITVAHVIEEWVVNRDGSYRENLDVLEVAQKPSPENIWTCASCGKEAKVT